MNDFEVRCGCCEDVLIRRVRPDVLTDEQRKEIERARQCESQWVTFERMDTDEE